MTGIISPEAHPLNLPVEIMEAIVEASIAMGRHAHRAYRISRIRRGRGRTLRPSEHTPLWNELRRQLKPHLAGYGKQANLGRLLGLPRQRVQQFMTQRDHMPDAERTLQLLAWLHQVRSRRPPS